MNLKDVQWFEAPCSIDDVHVIAEGIKEGGRLLVDPELDPQDNHIGLYLVTFDDPSAQGPEWDNLGYNMQVKYARHKVQYHQE